MWRKYVRKGLAQPVMSEAEAIPDGDEGRVHGDRR